MLPPLEIHVDGKGSSFRTAERGYLRLSFTTTLTDQSKAFDQVQAAVAKTTAAFRSLATKTEDGHPHPDAAITAFTVTPLSTLSRFQRDQYYRDLTSKPMEHTVSASAEVIFRDMARLAEVSNELATMAHVSVTGTEWRLTDPTRVELEREARLKAIHDAVAKAQDYAGVVGRKVVAVEIRDQAQAVQQSPWGRGVYPPVMQQQAAMLQQQAQAQAQAQASGTASAAVASDGPSLEPKTITVSAGVTVRFVSVDGEDTEDAVHSSGNSAKRARV